MTAALGPIAAQMADYCRFNHIGSFASCELKLTKSRGRKWFLVVLTGFGCIGSIIVARADSFGMAIAGFAVGGFSCVTQPLLHAVVSEVLPRRFRSWAQTSVNIAVALGAIYGLLVGGALTASNPENFRIYFYISAGFYTLVAIACALLYRPPPEKHRLSASAKNYGPSTGRDTLWSRWVSRYSVSAFRGPTTHTPGRVNKS